MAEASEKYDEKIEEDSSLTLSPSKELDPEPQNDREFAAIRSQSHARNPTSLRSLSRTRSNNGYGVGEAEEEGAVEKDPFEVHWEGGDADSLNPRSFGKGRKWVIVIIVSMSSLCV